MIRDNTYYRDHQLGQKMVGFTSVASYGKVGKVTSQGVGFNGVEYRNKSR